MCCPAMLVANTLLSMLPMLPVITQSPHHHMTLQLQSYGSSSSSSSTACMQPSASAAYIACTLELLVRQKK
jgi:hypothetical protein